MAFLDDYEPVEDRLVKFWSRHPGGQVVTELVEHGEGSYIVMASLYRGDELRDGRPAATGFAREVETQRGVNSTSALENCETSAIGRALANMGFAAKGKRPSREEMSKTAGAGAYGEDVPAPAEPSPAPVGTGTPEGVDRGGPTLSGAGDAKTAAYARLVSECGRRGVGIMPTLAKALGRPIAAKTVPDALTYEDLLAALAFLAKDDAA